jgi:hypothetical protein
MAPALSSGRGRPYGSRTGQGKGPYCDRHIWPGAVTYGAIRTWTA